MDQPVLVVDLDGTLIHTDMLHESALKLFRDRPLDTLRIPLWLSRGKAVLKEQLASRTHVDPKTLPYNTALLSWLKGQKSEGRRLALCTASDRSIADGIARHLDLFDEVMASDGTQNLAGPQKAQALVARFGDKGFDYAGNSEADLAVWAHARQAIVVEAPAGLVQKAAAVSTVSQVFERRPTGPSAWRRVLRVHQWLKNLLLFVPLIAAHDVYNLEAWGALVLSFFWLSLCASSV